MVRWLRCCAASSRCKGISQGKTGRPLPFLNILLAYFYLYLQAQRLKMLYKLIITLAILAVGLTATQAAVLNTHAQDHVETLIPRQHVCCDPQTGGNW